MDRFSEDLDFSLKQPDKNFDLSAYFPMLQKEVAAFGLDLKIEEKEKTVESNIKSAFLKGNTLEHMLMFYANADFSTAVSNKELLKIKFEVDVNPPSGATFEHKYSLRPSPYAVALYDVPSLFAGKIHAVLSRGWKNRVKGRDLYDYVFYLQKGATVNLPHLQQRLIQSGAWEESKQLTLCELKKLLCERFETIDYENAKSDVQDFIKDKSQLNLWSSAFFKSITENLL